jgi:hypothetical protein
MIGKNINQTVKIKKASPKKSQPLLTYEKHQVKITY